MKEKENISDWILWTKLGSLYILLETKDIAIKKLRVAKEEKGKKNVKKVKVDLLKIKNQLQV